MRTSNDITKAHSGLKVVFVAGRAEDVILDKWLGNGLSYFRAAVAYDLAEATGAVLNRPIEATRAAYHDQ